MSYFKNHKKKTIQILNHVAKHMKECEFDYEMIDLELALEEAKTHYYHYLKMKDDDKYKQIKRLGESIRNAYFIEEKPKKKDVKIKREI